MNADMSFFSKYLAISKNNYLHVYMLFPPVLRKLIRFCQLTYFHIEDAS